MLYRAQTCHLGSDMSCVELIGTLYKLVKQPEDHFILSKGHGAATMYAVLAEEGYFPKARLEEYGKKNTIFLNLVNSEVPGVEFSTGALGHGLPVACGLALAKKLSFQSGHVYTLLSDGELDCGTTWEGCLFAAHHKLPLTIIVDNNKIQACGFKKDIINVEPLKEKFEAFGLDVTEIDGHDWEAIKQSLLLRGEKPQVIIANTIKGKGISFAENNNEWHYKNMNMLERGIALRENRTIES